DALIVRAIQYELDRGGQVYFVHNRVETIYGVKNALQTLLPSARIAVAHGQMGEAEIEPVMSAFVDGEIDILLATTIIENGLDIPNANTLIVNNADQFGLSQLYQLRGRVGRSNHQAYAYLLYQPHKALTEEAKARLEAIREFSHLGSGLQLAMRDLEIRGAGNLLGHAQSGHIAAVGFDTYCQLLAEAVAERQGKVREQAQEAVLDLKLTAYIPDDYITQASQKIAVYQQLAAARSAQEVDEIAAGLRDRFGPMPEPLQYLVEITKLRTLALRKRVTRLVVDDHRLVLGVGTGFELSPRAIPDLQRLTGGHFRFSDQRLTVDLPDGSPATWLPLLGALLETL
ncbi:MAG: transcription-repair coupling factor, partial [Castellaniella sp.]|uniref:TRCF domain-containing protein n=1 Tax=Castellaniella sp. TaxID=1955812 RepID=UPI001211D953